MEGIKQFRAELVQQDSHDAVIDILERIRSQYAEYAFV
jgi:hypothetical protein